MLTDDKLRQLDPLFSNGPEYSVLGSMLLDPRTVPVLLQLLTEDDFPDESARAFFFAFRSLFLERAPIDPVSVVERIARHGYEERAALLMRLTPTAANCEAYARMLRDRRQLRQIQEACMEIVDTKTDLERAKEILAQAAALLVENQRERDLSYGELISELLDRQQDKTPPDCFDWGIPALDEKLVNVGPGSFVILAADSSVGKTALALQFALSIARKKRVGFFSYETTLAAASDRLVSNDADVSFLRTKQKTLTSEEIARIVQAGIRSDKVDLRVMETATYTVDKIRAKTIARRFEVIFVDYLQLVPTSKKERYEAVTEVSIGLHALAQELGVTVVGLSQVTVPEKDKHGDRRYISKDDLRESRQLKQDADAILIMDLADPKDQDSDRVLQIAKNRDGNLANLALRFDPYRMRFSYIPPFEDPETAKARERYAKMDANREARREKERRKASGVALDGQGSVFTDLDDGEGGEIPF